MVFSKGRWNRSFDLARQLAKITVRKIYTEAGKASNDKERQAIVDHARRSESRRAIADMLFLAESELPVKADAFDRHTYLLNVRNGTLDLTTGKLRKPDPADFLTKMSPTPFNPRAKCEKWEAFQHEIACGDENLISFKRRWYGYALTGDVGERKFFVAWGSGCNGKSTEIETLRHILGSDYVAPIPTETLTVQKFDGAIPNDIAALQGARLAVASECEVGKTLAEAKVKKLCGGEALTARFLHAEYFSFMPQFKLVLLTNHRPEIRGTDSAIWSRVLLTPYTYVVPSEQIDRNLIAKLRGEAEGILAWCVQGCLEWQRMGLSAPPCVTDATVDYRRDMDVIGRFLEEMTIKGPGVTEKSLLFEAFKHWSVENGEAELSKSALSKRLQEKGLTNGRRTAIGRETWGGIRLKDGKLLQEHAVEMPTLSGSCDGAEASEVINIMNTTKETYVHN